jgi:Flp pilus assembly protein CpaB
MSTSTSAPQNDSGFAVDRQRERESRGSRPGRTASGRLPSPPRERRPLTAALAVLLIVGGAALAGLLALRVDSRVPVLVASHDIAVGHQLTKDDLAVARMASDGIAAISSSKAGQVEGTYATEGIRAGQLIDASMVARTGFLTPGSVAIGVPMASGRVPSDGLDVGDVVQVLQVPKDAKPVVLVDRAVVSSTSDSQKTSTGAFGGSSSNAVSSTDRSATLIIAAGQAADVAAASAADQIVLVLVERGATTQAGG